MERRELEEGKNEEKKKERSGISKIEARKRDENKGVERRKLKQGRERKRRKGQSGKREGEARNRKKREKIGKEWNEGN